MAGGIEALAKRSTLERYLTGLAVLLNLLINLIRRRPLGDYNLKCEFPGRTVTDRDKVLWVLAHRGKQCFCNLVLLTGIPENELRRILSELEEVAFVDEKGERQHLTAEQKRRGEFGRQLFFLIHRKP